MPRHVLFQKRHFSGNRYTNVSKTPSKSTASSRKITVTDTQKGTGNIVVNLDILNELICDVVACKTCHGLLTISERIESRGLASYLEVTCSNCGPLSNSYTSKQVEGGMELNIRAVYGMRFIGKGHQALRKFCAVMDLPPAPAKAAYHRISKMLEPVIVECATDSMRLAQKECKDLADSKDVAISLDGSWQKRGYKSLNGLVSALSVETGLYILLHNYTYIKTFYTF